MAPFYPLLVVRDIPGTIKDSKTAILEVISQYDSSSEFADRVNQIVSAKFRGMFIGLCVLQFMALVSIILSFFLIRKLFLKQKQLKFSVGITQHQHSEYLNEIARVLQHFYKILLPYVKKGSNGFYLDLQTRDDGFEEASLGGIEVRTVGIDGDVTIEHTHTVQIDRTVEVDKDDIANGGFHPTIVSTGRPIRDAVEQVLC